MCDTVVHLRILVSSLWRVFLVTLFSLTDMPSLTTVTLNKGAAFKHKKTIHTKSSSPSPPSFLDITPALQQYLQFIVSFTHNSSIPCTPPALSTTHPITISIITSPSSKQTTSTPPTITSPYSNKHPNNRCNHSNTERGNSGRSSGGHLRTPRSQRCWSCTSPAPWSRGPCAP